MTLSSTVCTMDNEIPIRSVGKEGDRKRVGKALLPEVSGTHTHSLSLACISTCTHTIAHILCRQPPPTFSQAGTSPPSPRFTGIFLPYKISPNVLIAEGRLISFSC